MKQVTVNLKIGMPEVSSAINTMNAELRRAKANRIHVVKIIHGWGSTGVGGTIRKAVHKELKKKKQNHFIVDFVPGEDFTSVKVKGADAVKKYPELKRDIDFGKDNIGITIVIVS